jgi:hypothetical protein
MFHCCRENFHPPKFYLEELELLSEKLKRKLKSKLLAERLTIKFGPL